LKIASAGTTDTFFSPMTFTFQQLDFRDLDMGLKQTVYAQGEITPGTANRFAAFLKIHNVRPGEEVMFDSPGGSLIEGIAIGEIIRAKNLNTEVGVQGNILGGGACYSSCTLAFLGGVYRYVDAGSEFGVHQFYSSSAFDSDQAFSFSQEVSGQVLAYIISMDVSPMFLTDMSEDGPTQINILSQRTLHDLNVITPDFTTIWNLNVISGGIYFRGTVKNTGGTHKFIFFCPQQNTTSPSLMALIEADDYSQHVIDVDPYVDLVFDYKEVPILENEIFTKPKTVNNDIVLTITLTPRLMKYLNSATTLGIELLPPSRQTYFGFTSDLSSGKTQLFDFLNSCSQ
jgi:hypothetical protein